METKAFKTKMEVDQNRNSANGNFGTIDRRLGNIEKDLQALHVAIGSAATTNNAFQTSVLGYLQEKFTDDGEKVRETAETKATKINKLGKFRYNN